MTHSDVWCEQSYKMFKEFRVFVSSRCGTIDKEYVFNLKKKADVYVATIAVDVTNSYSNRMILLRVSFFVPLSDIPPLHKHQHGMFRRLLDKARKTFVRDYLLREREDKIEKDLKLAGGKLFNNLEQERLSLGKVSA